MRISKKVERWFPAPEDPDKSEHLIRNLLPGEEEDIYIENSSQETKYIKKGDELEPEVYQKSNLNLISQIIRVKAIADWKNMYDENGNVLKCTTENKIRALREIEGYKEFIDKCRAKLKADIKDEKAVLEKN